MARKYRLQLAHPPRSRTSEEINSRLLNIWEWESDALWEPVVFLAGIVA